MFRNQKKNPPTEKTNWLRIKVTTFGTGGRWLTSEVLKTVKSPKRA